MRAIIFATGESAELAPLSDRVPVPLLPLVDRPLLQHIIEALATRNVRDIDVVLSHLPDSVEQFLGDGERWGCRFTFHLARDSRRPYRFLRVLNLGDEPVLLGHADRLVELPAELLAVNRPQLLTWNDEESGSTESPRWTGWAVLPPDVLKRVAGDPTEDELAAHLFDLMSGPNSCLQVRRPIPIRAFSSYFEVQEAVLDKKAPTFISQGRETDSGVWLGRNVSVHPTARIQPPVFIGANSVVGPEVVLGPYAVVGRDCMLDAHSRVTRSVVFPGSYVGEGLELVDVFVDRNVLVNPRLETALTFPDPLLLGSLSDVGVVPPLQAALSRMVAATLLILSLPVMMLTAIWLKITRPGPILFRHRVLRPPAPGHAPARTTDLWSFRADTAWKCSDVSMRGLLLQFLPSLVNIARGQLAFVGLPPRSAAEVEELPSEWRAFHLCSKAGIVSDTSFLIGNGFSDDERFAGEAHYACVANWQYDLRLLGRYFVRCLAGPLARAVVPGPGERRSSTRHFTHLVVLSADDQERNVAIGRDISSTGMGLESPRDYPAGTRIAVKLYNPRRQAACVRLLIVCHATTQANGTYLLGCRFSREMSEEELQKLKE